MRSHFQVFCINLDQRPELDAYQPIKPCTVMYATALPASRCMSQGAGTSCGSNSGCASVQTFARHGVTGTWCQGVTAGSDQVGSCGWSRAVTSVCCCLASAAQNTKALLAEEGLACIWEGFQTVGTNRCVCPRAFFCHGYMDTSRDPKSLVERQSLRVELTRVDIF